MARSQGSLAKPRYARLIAGSARAKGSLALRLGALASLRQRATGCGPQSGPQPRTAYERFLCLALKFDYAVFSYVFPSPTHHPGYVARLVDCWSSSRSGGPRCAAARLLLALPLPSLAALADWLAGSLGGRGAPLVPPAGSLSDLRKPACVLASRGFLASLVAPLSHSLSRCCYTQDVNRLQPLRGSIPLAFCFDRIREPQARSQGSRASASVHYRHPWLALPLSMRASMPARCFNSLCRSAPQKARAPRPVRW